MEGDVAAADEEEMVEDAAYEPYCFPNQKVNTRTRKQTMAAAGVRRNIDLPLLYP